MDTIKIMDIFWCNHSKKKLFDIFKIDDIYITRINISFYSSIQLLFFPLANTTKIIHSIFLLFL